jgi:hypothetical protein
MITLNDLGFSITLPERWDGRIFRGSSGAAILQAGSFPLPEYDADLGFGAEDTMPADGIYLNIADQGEPGPWLTPGVWEKATLPIQVGPEHITMFEGSPAESLAGRWAILNGHCLLIHVAFGVAAPAKQQIAIANGVLATFAIAARLAVIQ